MPSRRRLSVQTEGIQSLHLHHSATSLFGGCGIIALSKCLLHVLCGVAVFRWQLTMAVALYYLVQVLLFSYQVRGESARVE